MHHALTEAVRIKANAVAIFTKNQRTWKGAPLSDEAAAQFKQTMKEVNFDPEMILPHGSYLINLCSPDEGLEKSRMGFLDELKRCEALGIKRYCIFLIILIFVSCMPESGACIVITLKMRLAMHLY